MVVYLRKRPWIAIVVMLVIVGFGANLMAQSLTIKGKGGFKDVYADHSVITGSGAWITTASTGFPSIGNKDRLVITDIIISNPSATGTVVDFTTNGAVILEDLAIWLAQQKG